MLINPDIAIWILKTFQYPYARCSDFSIATHSCDTSLISWVGRSLEAHTRSASEKGYELLDYFITRGEPLNTLTGGMTPVHEAILYRNARYLKILLSAGPDPRISIDKPGKPYDTYNAYQFLDLLESMQKADFVVVRKVLEQYR